MMSTPLATLKNAMRSLIRRAISTLQTLRPLVAEIPAGPATLPELDGDQEPEASPAPIPETIPEPDDDVVPAPAAYLSAATIPVAPPLPKCAYPTDWGYDWMLSHRFVAAVGSVGSGF